ncbi:MAG: hypothetical protein B7Z80_15885 [Rhodospirillales bacterium 20-64-7]|nr:MAG: hypothetical protein B7Z80_15885 [Rhodospirillales bacterium 20-64-7]HQT78450.1 formyltransferase family protein [Rhodopila sp.]
MRIALLTLEALASAEPVRRFVTTHRDRIVLVALSDPYRPQQGGMTGQAIRLLRQSGPRLLPYMIANFSLPRIAGMLPLRRRTPERTPMAQLCRSLGIAVETAADMNAAQFQERLRQCDADLIVTFHCDQILTQTTISCPRWGAINVHAGLLPDHRGPVPTIHALLAETPRFGVTVHRLVPRIDAGPILAQEAVALPATTTALAAALHLHWRALPLLSHVLDALETGSATDRLVEPGPYCGFPTSAQLRHLSGMRRRAASWRDVMHALRVPA